MPEKKTTPAVTHCEQPKDSLCWATCIKMVLEVKRKKVNNDITPQNIAARCLYEDKNKVNVGLDDWPIKAGLEAYNVTPTYVKGTITWDAIKAEIDASHPVIVGVTWKGGGGHVMVIGGYEDVTAKWLLLHDPLRTAVKKVSYDGLVNGQYNAKLDTGFTKGMCKWDATFKTA